MSSVRTARLSRLNAVAGELFRIDNGGTNSNEIDWQGTFGDAEAISFAAPATLPETVVIQLDPGDGTFRTLCDSTNTAIAMPTAGKIQVYNGVITACAKIRLQAGGAVAANRDYIVSKAFRT